MTTKLIKVNAARGGPPRRGGAAGKPAKSGAASPGRGTDPEPADARRAALLEAALTVFTRYGFRKTSMDEVARAAQVSRQGLYLHYASKEELFRATVAHVLGVSLTAARTSLRDPSRPLPERLVLAFDQWVGRFVGMLGGTATDLAEALGALIGPLVAEHEERFAEALTGAIAGSRLVVAYRPAGVSARQLADTLAATARGLKHGCPTRAAFVEQMTTAVRALCLPLGGAA